jgi:hypothetical protein
MLAMGGVLKLVRSLGRTKCFFDKEPEGETSADIEEGAADSQEPL